MSGVVEVTDQGSLFNGALSSQNKYTCVLFTATWHDSNSAMVELATEFSNDEDFKMFKFYYMAVDTHAALLQKLNSKLPDELRVTQVPTFVFLKKGKLFKERIVDPEPPAVIEMLEDAGSAEDSEFVAIDVSSGVPAVPVPKADALADRLLKLVKREPVMLFMKGNPQEPRCGFSRKCVDLLASEGIEYGSFDILSDNDVRQGLKTVFDWQTYPQLYANGTLIGGLDILLELQEDGALHSDIELAMKKNSPAEAAKPETLQDRLRKLVKQEPVMLFMKGTPQEPRCGFSRKCIDLLKEQGIKHGHFDILSDNDVRQGLKSLYDWQTYPQLYSNGILIGGLDILLELAEDEELQNEINRAKGQNENVSSNLETRLKKLVNQDTVMLFMKGNPDEPKCGFSRTAVQLLRDQSIEFGTFDILSDEVVRAGLKEYSNWPTYPQLYAYGQLLGGLDIMEALIEGNELQTAIADAAQQ